MSANDIVVSARVTSFAPSPPPANIGHLLVTKALLDGGMRQNPYDGGAFKVAGTVAIDATPDIPVKRRVRLFCRVTGRMVAETWSDAVSGAYLFESIRVGPWTVVGYDYADSYNAVVADNISGVPM